MTRSIPRLLPGNATIWCMSPGTWLVRAPRGRAQKKSGFALFELLVVKLDAAAKAALKKCLGDESGDMRAMATYALIKAGDQAAGQACLIEMIKNDSPASCRAINVTDWMGVDRQPYIPA